MAMELIETIEVGAGGAASIEFTSIPQDGVDLLLVVSARLSGGFFDAYYATIYNVNNSTYPTGRFLTAKSGSVSSGNYSSGWDGFYVDTDAATSNTFGNGQLYFPNYASSVAKSVSKDSVTENNASAVALTLGADLLNTTSPITAVKVFTTVGTFAQYSTASLYKITKA